jgi:(+)-neomenthol dehydrogenase
VLTFFLQEDLRTFVDGYLGSLQQSYELAKECLDVNFNGTKDVTACLIPLLLLSNSGRIVNVSTTVAQLKVSLHHQSRCNS